MVGGVRVQRREEDTATTSAVSRDSRQAGHGAPQRFGNRVAQRMLRRPEDGLPEPLRAGVEALSGLSMDAVRVHRDSSRPAQVHAHAFAHGADIHLGPGQERHLPHEAWHVVQQAQGRARPGMQAGGVAINADRGLEREADTMGERAASGATWAPRSLMPMRTTTPVLQAKSQAEIARHGSFDIRNATYRLLEGEGCEIGIKFKLGTGIPASTQISFIQALKTITTHTDTSITSAQTVGAQAPTDNHERLDQFKGNPSAYYLDYIDEHLVELINLAAMEHPPYDIRTYATYRDYSMEPVSEQVFNNFWQKYDAHRLDQLLTVQTDTSNPAIKMSQGKKLDPASFSNFFNLFNSDIDAQIYDMPKNNLRAPTAVGDVSTCMFHTAAVTKVLGGDATVWDVIQWGYTITMVGEGVYTWALLPLQAIPLDGAMLGPALAKMRETTPNFVGPSGLVAAG
jgi:hypothetical protein